MNQSVKDGIGQRWVPNGLMPMFHRERTGDNSRPSPVSVFQEFKQVSAILIIPGGKSTIIKNQPPLAIGSSWKRRGNRK